MKKIIFTFILAVSVFMLVACANSDKDSAVSGYDEAKSKGEISDYYNAVLSAKGSSLSFYGWGGNEDRNRWLAEVFAPHLKKKFDIELNVVGMNIDDILAKLAAEKQSNSSGSVDMIWINGENFYSAKQNGLLYGPFTDILPNFHKYIDSEDREVKMDFGFSIDGYEAPYAKAQLVFINDANKTNETPSNAEELMEYAKNNQGKLTYPAPPDFTGSAFVRTLIYDIVGADVLENVDANKEDVKKAIKPAIDYMKDLNQYLWNEGKSFPASSGELDKMFEDGEVLMTVSYSPFQVAMNIEKGIYEPSVRTFVFDKGTVGNTNYIAISNKSANKDAAIVAINEILSPEMQRLQYEALKTLPVLDYKKLSSDELAKFKSVDLGKGVLPNEVLASKRLAEMPANIIPLIEEIWLEEVVGK